jgi:hypothetical protein
MSKPLILLHQEALRRTHPVFDAAPAETKAIYVWDDAFLKDANYSLKRLVFVYETLCELPVDIIRGGTLETVLQLAPSLLYIPAANNPLLISLIDSIKKEVPAKIVEDEPFVTLQRKTEFKRFFQYWNKAEKTAFLLDGSEDA